MRLSRSFMVLLAFFSSCSFAAGTPVFGAASFETHNGPLTVSIVKTPKDGGIREDFPIRFKARFEKWKAELLSTEIGRQQWERFAANKYFVLRVEISDGRGRGAGTDKFEWDDQGNFVGATIMLGAQLEEGFPDPVYYPVLNSLAAEPGSYSINGKTIAATKIAHEMGHVEHIAASDISVVQVQNKLMPVYNSIFLKNGFKTSDQQLIDIETEMGGKPIEIWESREYWSEVNAMVFLHEKINGEDYYCNVFRKIKNNIDSYARDYGKRFSERSEFNEMKCWK